MDLEARRPGVQQTFCRLEPQQAPANDRGARGLTRVRQDAVAIGQRAKDKGPRLEPARVRRQAIDRGDQRAAARGNDELVVCFDDGSRAGQTARPSHLSCGDVDRFHAHARMKCHAIGCVPRERVDEDVLGPVAAGEHARQQDAVVVAAGLVAEDGDRKLIAAAAREHVFHQPRARHAVADDDQAAFAVAHAGLSDAGARAGLKSCATCRTESRSTVVSARTAQTLNSGIPLVGSRAALVRRFADNIPPQ